MTRILLVGKDFDLLYSRARLFESLDASSVQCAPNEFSGFDVRAFDVVMLCHTLHDTEVTAVAENVRQRSPRTRVVKIRPVYAGVDDAAQSIEEVPALPLELLAYVSGVIANLQSELVARSA